jgi:hypothetical protein
MTLLVSGNIGLSCWKAILTTICTGALFSLIALDDFVLSANTLQVKITRKNEIANKYMRILPVTPVESDFYLLKLKN